MYMRTRIAVRRLTSRWINFLDAKRKLVVCDSHAALFRIHDGHFIAGAHLATVDTTVESGTVFPK